MYGKSQVGFSAAKVCNTYRLTISGLVRKLRKNIINEDEKIKSYIDNISPVYRVNTASRFNSKYVTNDTGNSNAKSLDDLKVKNPTLIKIDNDTIVSYYEGVSTIIDGINK